MIFLHYQKNRYNIPSLFHFFLHLNILLQILNNHVNYILLNILFHLSIHIFHIFPNHNLHIQFHSIFSHLNILLQIINYHLNYILVPFHFFHHLHIHLEIISYLNHYILVQLLFHFLFLRKYYYHFYYLNNLKNLVYIFFHSIFFHSNILLQI